LVDRKKPGVDQDLAKLGAGRKPFPDSAMGSRPGQMHSETLIAGCAGFVSFAGRPVLDTIYAGHPGSRRPAANTVFAGHSGARRPAMDTIYAGHPGAQWPVPGGNMAPGQRVSQIVTKKITDPATRQPVTVSYNTVTGLYLDKSLNRWLMAPPWISAQFRR